MSLRDEKKEFISYRNGAKRSYIAFEKQIYRTNEVSISQKRFASEPYVSQLSNTMSSRLYRHYRKEKDK